MAEDDDISGMTKIHGMCDNINHRLEGMLDQMVDIRNILRDTIAKMKSHYHDLRYKDYMASITFLTDEQTYYGTIAGIKDLVSFEGATLAELEQAFQEAVDDYIELCRKAGKEPEGVHETFLN